MAENPVDVLERWEDSGAIWRIESLTDERATVVLCTCTGEPVDRIESADDQLLGYLRERERERQDAS